MNPYNPYEAPTAGDGRVGGNFGRNDEVQAMCQEAMSRTKPWVQFLAILGFLGAGLMILFGLITMASGAAFSALGGGLGKLGPVLGLVYVILGGFYFVPSLYLWRYGASIGDYLREGAQMDGLVSPIRRQASFWRFVGIFTAIMLGLYLLLIFVAILAGIGAAVSR